MHWADSPNAQRVRDVYAEIPPKVWKVSVWDSHKRQYATGEMDPADAHEIIAKVLEVQE